jgi:hypothetical protein
VYVDSKIIVPERTEDTRNKGRRFLVILACAAMLYFAVGGAVPHEHSDGHENACHVCQALHMPALAAATLDLAAVPEIVTRYSTPLQNVLPNRDFLLLRAGRAPPTV